VIVNKTLFVRYGSLQLNIPYSVFVHGTSELNETSNEYFSMLQRRYPWLTDNSVTVLRRKVGERMQEVIEEETRGAVKARVLSASGRDTEAIRHLESYLIEEPEDGDAWYALGEILCKIGRNEEGYRMINHGRRFL